MCFPFGRKAISVVAINLDDGQEKSVKLRPLPMFATEVRGGAMIHTRAGCIYTILAMLSLAPATGGSAYGQAGADNATAGARVRILAPDALRQLTVQV